MLQDKARTSHQFFVKFGPIDDLVSRKSLTVTLRFGSPGTFPGVGGQAGSIRRFTLVVHDTVGHTRSEEKRRLGTPHFSLRLTNLVFVTRLTFRYESSFYLLYYSSYICDLYCFVEFRN
jgi:hypothetical protein